jgi:hypothetical protein
MRVLTLLLIIICSGSFVRGERQTLVEGFEQYEVVMCEGFPPESIPKKARQALKPEKTLLVARVAEDGKFHAESGDVMFEGRLIKVKDGKVEIEIKRSQLYSTSAFPFKAVVKLNEAIRSKAFAFQSIVFSYYFRVRSGNKRESQ